MSELFNNTIPYSHLVLRAGVVYLAIILLLRVSGKRQMGQMNATEFVAMLLISNAVQNAMNGGDNSLTGGLVLALVLIAISWLISWLTYRNKVARKIFEGTPTILIHGGTLIPKNMNRELLSDSELFALLRKQGIHNIQEVDSAILEADGTLSIYRKQPPVQKG